MGVRLTPSAVIRVYPPLVVLAGAAFLIRGTTVPFTPTPANKVYAQKA
jgi:hypothetical protein